MTIIYSYVFDNCVYNFKNKENATASVAKQIEWILDKSLEEDYISEDMYKYYYEDFTSQIDFQVGCSETIWVEDYTDCGNIKLYAGRLQDE